MKMQKTLVICAILLGLVPGAYADAKTKSNHNSNVSDLVGSLKEVCKSDLNKFCKDITPGEGRLASCLDSREDQLSTECKAAWSGTKTQVSRRLDKTEVALRKNCGKDIQKFCSNVPSGRGRLLDCLDDHEEKLSPSCHKFEEALDEKLSETVG